METLYRKYRPIDFDTVVGQEAIVRTLKNQIEKGAIAHAYLFCGTRGTGKTTIAKIFARAINCKNVVDGNPCNRCNTCVSSLSATNLNIIEMDAASNRGVEDIRKINELIAYPPINDEKYKVFIIDEAHALTKEATQAFLKILEEPPEYVVYILATTDPNKLPETILSRCQKYNFKRINIETMVSYLKKICDEEKIMIDDDALTFIAEKSDGSMRESISKLDRCRAYAFNDKLDKKKVLDVLGVVDDDDFEKLVAYVNLGDIKSAFTLVSECLDKGKDIVNFANDLIWHLRNLLIAKDLKEPVETLNITKENFEKLKKETEEINRDTLIYFIEELSRTVNLMKFDENRRVIFETTLIRLATPSSNYVNEAVMARLMTLEEKIKKGSFVTVEEAPKATKIKDSSDSEKEKEKEKKVDKLVLSKATYEEVKKVIESWSTIIAPLEFFTKSVFSKSKVVPSHEKEPGAIEVLVDDSYQYELIRTNDKEKDLEKRLSARAKEIVGKDILFKVLCIDDTKYSKDVKISLDDAQKYIDIPIGVEDDK